MCVGVGGGVAGVADVVGGVLSCVGVGVVGCGVDVGVGGASVLEVGHLLLLLLLLLCHFLWCEYPVMAS